MPWIYRMALILFTVSLPVFIYVGLRFARALSDVSQNTRFPVSLKAARIGVAIFGLWVYLWPLMLVFSYLTGSVRELFIFSHEMRWEDYLIVFPSWWSMIACAEILPFFLVLDITGWIKKKRNSRNEVEERKQTAKPWLLYVKLGLVVFFLVYVGFRTWFDTYHLQINTVHAEIKDLPEGTGRTEAGAVRGHSYQSQNIEPETGVTEKNIAIR